MLRIELILSLFISSLLLSQESYNSSLIGNWFEPNENYWSDNISDFNDVWGHESEGGIRYALMGGWDGTYIVDITTNPSSPQLVSFIPGSTSSHRDIKTYQNFMYVGTEANFPDPVLYEQGEYYVQPQGVQVIDISDPSSPQLAAEWDGVVQSHNLMEADGYLYVIGSNDLFSNDGEVESWGIDDLIILDLSDPSSPLKVGGWSGVYLHDVCVYDDILYGCDIYNDNMYAFDISDKTNPTVITQWPGILKSHSCWVSEDGETLFTGSETTGGHIMSWDVSNLSNVEFLDEWMPDGGEDWSAHNVFVLGERLYISYYVYGLQVLDISDPTDLHLAAYYDTFDMETESIYNGAWGAYPFFGSDNVIISDRRTGLYVVDIFNDGYNMLGDVNFDSAVNVVDIVTIISFIMEASQPTDLQLYLSDLNEDGSLDIMDIIVIINSIILN